jgi:hypothetical protein
MTPVWAREGGEAATPITVSVYDDAGVGLAAMQEAEAASAVSGDDPVSQANDGNSFSTFANKD